MATIDYKRTPSHVRRLRSEKSELVQILGAMISAFDNEEYGRAYSLAADAQESYGALFATFNMYRGWQENGVREEAWAR